MTPARAEMTLNLVPMPREVEAGDGTASLSAQWTVCVQDLHPEDLHPAQQIAADANRCFGWTWKVEKSVPEKNYILLKGFTAAGETPEHFDEQGYVLRVEPDRIFIEAPSSQGRFYGAQTLRQLIRHAAATKANTIPVMKITDYPVLEWRGISDDISRGQVSTLEDFEQIIETLAYYKKNMYEPYIEDMFRFDVSPNVGSDRGAITKVEMARMVETAKKNYVTLTPVFETLGHQDRLLSLPENLKYAEVQDPDKTPWSFAPVSEEAFQFVTQLVDELAKATPSPFFHIGGDESWDVGEGLSKEAVENYGVGKVHADYYTRLVNYIKDKYDRRTLLYGDMLLRHPDALKDLSKDSIIVDWHYHPAEDYPSIKTIKDAGFENIFVSPGIWGWANFYPNYGVGFRNIGYFVDAGKKAGVMGSITSSWGDRGAENLRTNNWPGYAFSAAVEWQENTPGDMEFFERFLSTQFAMQSKPLAEAYHTLGWIEYIEANYKDGMFHKKLRIKLLTPEWLETTTRLEADMKSVREAVARERKTARIDADQLDGVDHAARRYLYMARRDLALHNIAERLGSKPIRDLPKADREAILADLVAQRAELIGIIDEFSRLWLRNNKYPKLDFNLERLQEQVANLQHLIVIAQDGELEKAPPPTGTWFWYPEKDPRTETTVENPHFLRVVELKEMPLSATLQCWADDRATVFVNGRRVFRTTYPEDPKSAEVRPYLHEGDNYIALQARNTHGAAGIMFELALTFPDQSSKVITGDDEWRAAETVGDDWQTQPPRGEAWKPVMLLGTGSIEPWKFLNW